MQKDSFHLSMFLLHVEQRLFMIKEKLPVPFKQAAWICNLDYF